MSALNVREAIDRVAAFMATRKEHEAFPNDTIVDIDMGSRGHVRLLESDLLAILEATA